MWKPFRIGYLGRSVGFELFESIHKRALYPFYSSYPSYPSLVCVCSCLLVSVYVHQVLCVCVCVCVERGGAAFYHSNAPFAEPRVSFGVGFFSFQAFGNSSGGGGRREGWALRNGGSDWSAGCAVGWGGRIVKVVRARGEHRGEEGKAGSAKDDSEGPCGAEGS